MKPEEWQRLAELARRARQSNSAVMRAAASLLQAHVLVDALAENLLHAIEEENLPGNEVVLQDRLAARSRAANSKQLGRDRLWLAALNDGDGATMKEHLVAALENNC